MNTTERQALREKHRERQDGTCDWCIGMNDAEEIVGIPYPCDTIKVLDELEMWIKE